MTIDMPKESKLKLPSIGFQKTTIGERIANFRKKLGWTQAELAEKMGSLRSLVSDYERGKLRVHGEMLARFSLALEVSTDELIGINGKEKEQTEKKISLSLWKRLKKIEMLPIPQKKTLLQTIDAFLKGNGIQ